MAIDKTLLETYKSGYANYLSGMKAMNITSGKDYEEVERNYNRMLELGEECNDGAEFTAKLNSENVLTNMQAAYTRAITANATQNYGNPVANAQRVSGNAAGTTTNIVVDTVASAAQPLLRSVPGGQYVAPLTGLLRWVPNLIARARERRKNKRSGDGTTGTSTRVTRTS